MTPHEPSEPNRADLGKDPARVSGMFDQVAKNYDRTNTVLSMGNDQLWRAATTRAVAPEARAAHPRPRRRHGRVIRLARPQRRRRRRGRLLARDDRRGAAPARRHPESHVRRGGCHEAAVRRRLVRHRHDVVRAAQRERAAHGARRAAAGDQARAAAWSCASSRTRRRARSTASTASTTTAVLPVVAKTVSSNAEAYEYLNESIRDWPDQRTLGDLDPRGGMGGCRVPQPLVRHRRPAPRRPSPPEGRNPSRPGTPVG